MKSVNQLLASAHNLPAVETVQAVPVSAETTAVVNALFRKLRGIFPAWRQAWPSTEALNAAKEEWIQGFAAQGIRSLEQIEFGIQNCRKAQKPFAPSVGEFIAMCRPSPECLGMPSAMEAWIEVLMGTYSHEAVRLAARATGLFDLRGARPDDKGLRQRFERHYAVILLRAQVGLPVEAVILSEIDQERRKTELQRADEHADRQVQARMIQQGIPADGAQARELLMATLGKRSIS